MKKVLLAAVGLSGVLASCGSVAVGDGAFAQVTQIRTEYRYNGQFIGCDNVLSGTQQLPGSTQVAVYFNAGGSIRSVDVGLRGITDDEYNGNYNGTFTGNQFDSVGGNSYKVTFDANPATGGFLPQAIIVNPTDRTVKNVTATGRVANGNGGFYAELTLNTATDSGTVSTETLGSAGNIPVYTNCYVQSTTNETI